MKITAGNITKRLIRTIKKSSFVLPRYTPGSWFECDVFEVTAHGYFYEYEIKLSVADFLADAKKSSGTMGKHWALANGCEIGPVHFSFVTPRGLLAGVEIPAWAGLIEIVDCGSCLGWRDVKKAPRLHEAKLDPEILEHARGVCYWRYLHALLEAPSLDPAS
jgi:hypothetical protein